MKTNEMKKKLLIEDISTITLTSLCFILMFSYSVARVSITSLLLEEFVNESLSVIFPYAWITTGITTFFVVIIYNNLSYRYSLMKLYYTFSLFSGVVFIFLFLLYDFNPKVFIFLLYIWKETYIIVLVKLFWSFWALTFDSQVASMKYRLFSIIGTLGATGGDLLIGRMASIWGTYNALFIVFPSLLICSSIALKINFLFKHKRTRQISEGNFLSSIKVVWNSKYLVPLALLMCILQLSTTVIEYKYNFTLKMAYPELDQRTDISGMIQALINILTLFILILTPNMIKKIGISGILITIPITLSILIISFSLNPSMTNIVVLRIFSKVACYSLFRGAKELLYIPLDKEEIIHGKSFIDMFGFRSSQAFTSLLVMVLANLNLEQLILISLIMFQVVWVLLTFLIIKRFNELNHERY